MAIQPIQNHNGCMHEIKQSWRLNEKLTVFFDGGCPVCRAEIKAYQKADVERQVAWVDISQCAESELGPQLKRSDALARLHVRQSDGRLVSGARAFVEIWAALPRWRWLSTIARIPGMIFCMELAYVTFLRLRPLWRQPNPACPLNGALQFNQDLLRWLRTDHAGETGAVMIYRGILNVSRDPKVRTFAQHHLQSELRHLELMNEWVNPRQRSKLLPVWRIMGWLTGALPALFGARSVYATIEAVETFVDHHYALQIQAIDDFLAPPTADQDMRLSALRDILEQCRQDEVAHRDEAASLNPTANNLAIKLWTWLVGLGSRNAVHLARWI